MRRASLRTVIGAAVVSLSTIACGGSPTEATCVRASDDVNWSNAQYSFPVRVNPNESAVASFTSYGQQGNLFVKPAELVRVTVTVHGTISCPQDLTFTARTTGGRTMTLFQNEGPCEINNGADRVLFEDREVKDLFGQPAGDWLIFITNTGRSQNFVRADGRSIIPFLNVKSSGSIRTFTQCSK